MNSTVDGWLEYIANNGEDALGIEVSPAVLGAMLDVIDAADSYERAAPGSLDELAASRALFSRLARFREMPG